MSNPPGGGHAQLMCNEEGWIGERIPAFGAGCNATCTGLVQKGAASQVCTLGKRACCLTPEWRPVGWGRSLTGRAACLGRETKNGALGGYFWEEQCGAGCPGSRGARVKGVEGLQAAGTKVGAREEQGWRQARVSLD